jgi:predicted MFS family arabinose efflux permease
VGRRFWARDGWFFSSIAGFDRDGISIPVGRFTFVFFGNCLEYRLHAAWDLISFYLLPGIVFASLGSLLGRRLGDKNVAILGLTLMVVGGVLFGTSHDYAIFLVGRLVSGVGAVLLNVLFAEDDGRMVRRS